jgi:hypothetical protein
MNYKCTCNNPAIIEENLYTNRMINVRVDYIYKNKRKLSCVNCGKPIAEGLYFDQVEITNA